MGVRVVVALVVVFVPEVESLLVMVENPMHTVIRKGVERTTTNLSGRG